MTHNEPAIGKFIDGEWAGALDEDTVTWDAQLTASITNPDLGANGFINARWKLNGHTVSFWVTIFGEDNGADLTMGGASWRLSLPIQANPDLYTFGFLQDAPQMFGEMKTRAVGSANVGHFGGTAHPYEMTDGSLPGQALVFYRDSSSTSVAGSDFPTTNELDFLLWGSYLANPDELALLP